MSLPPYVLRVDGREHRVTGGDLTESLLSVLRERLGITAPKDGCASGDCGACTVLVDGTLRYSCLILAAAVTGREVTTAAGTGSHDEARGIPQAFASAGVVQCGFCTPGLVLAAHVLLADAPDPDDAQVREGLAGNRCWCAGYGRVLAAIAQLSQERSR